MMMVLQSTLPSSLPPLLPFPEGAKKPSDILPTQDAWEKIVCSVGRMVQKGIVEREEWEVRRRKTNKEAYNERKGTALSCGVFSMVDSRQKKGGREKGWISAVWESCPPAGIEVATCMIKTKSQASSSIQSFPLTAPLSGYFYPRTFYLLSFFVVIFSRVPRCGHTHTKTKI
jgi:hypothetical protein